VTQVEFLPGMCEDVQRMEAGMGPTST